MSGKRWEGSAELKADIRAMIEERLENSLDIAVSTGMGRGCQIRPRLYLSERKRCFMRILRITGLDGKRLRE